ncbi:MAG TPA: indole-3-glycerol-phosphate synthase [Thermoanaerobaculia bacterium]|nr:indole-3-glycerol-phosphate synthase [Thermoanaerobaculia bacterium]
MSESTLPKARGLGAAALRPATRSGLPDVLQRILSSTAVRVASARGEPLALPAPALPSLFDNPFGAALRRDRGRAVIAEVKMGSPRLGSLRDRVDPERQAAAYARAGAAALSVVVEPEFFFGSYDLLRRCREASGLPAIAKDFVLDEVQLRWARDAGASAVLLIAAALERARLHELGAAARALGLLPLVETHDREDLDKLAGGAVDWELVGVNNRDLRTFQVDLGSSIELLPDLPAGALKVAESGLHSASDLQRLSDAGFDAFLIGETLLLDADPERKLRELLRFRESDLDRGAAP